MPAWRETTPARRVGSEVASTGWRIDFRRLGQILGLGNRSRATSVVPRAEMAMGGLLSGKNALITGAGRNIGRSIALEMAGQGANIFFTEVDRQRRADLERELSEYPVLSKGILSDISRTEEIDSLFGSLAQDRVNIDILVNNVGLQIGAGLNLEEWQRVFSTNVFGPIYLTKLISEMMIRNGSGCILFITSIHQWTVRRLPSYSGSKAALGMVIKELALDLAPYQIRVNGIAPGYVREDPKGRLLAHPSTPLYRTSINPCYIGRAAVYLASDHFSKFTTGTVLKIDAGLSLYNHFGDQAPPG